MDVTKLDIAGIKVAGSEVSIENSGLFASEGIDRLVEHIVFQKDLKKKSVYAWIIWEAARQIGICPASIHDLYRAMGRGEASGFTVPAMNLRALTYDSARAIFRAAKKINAGAFIFEIARSEMGYTDQRPLEYTAVCLAAGIKEGYRGPVFIQGDHFQIKLSDFNKDKNAAMDDIKKLITEAMHGGFYNIDIDASTLVDLSKNSLDEQQYNNCWVTSELTKYIRSHEEKGITISIGGEIGEVGSKNSTPEDLHAFMKGYLKLLGGRYEGISKISIQTGTTHGGVVLPDGSVAEVKVDFDALGSLSEISRAHYEMAGAVQHGASTLPKEAFNKFPQTTAAEIHLATQFQNIIYDNMPQDLRDEIYGWLKDNFKSEWKGGQTEEQFLYKMRKQALGEFKHKIYCLEGDVKNSIASKLEEEFDFLFQQLKIKNTKKAVDKFIKLKSVSKKIQDLVPQDLVDANFDGAD
ncbi:MAG: class II fructose-bisphosphate aldolase [Candidatus Omnitrophica bacterium]|nr:class II fructose-bisphosphate aldolase [Candidatus Omnitrophota bacterium]